MLVGRVCSTKWPKLCRVPLRFWAILRTGHSFFEKGVKTEGKWRNGLLKEVVRYFLTDRYAVLMGWFWGDGYSFGDGLYF